MVKLGALAPVAIAGLTNIRKDVGCITVACLVRSGATQVVLVEVSFRSFLQ